MGIGPSRRPSRGPQSTPGNSHSYKYPPKTENYFSSYFIMGGERFESSKPDAHLFGENEDLNFLGSKPTPFPYPVPQPHEPTKTLRSLVNIRRDSVRFVKDIDEMNNSSTNDASRTRYNIEFTFDTDVKCAITVYYFAKEEIINKHATYHPRDPNMNSEAFHYKRGVNQMFSQPTHFIDPSQFNEVDWKYNTESEVIPVVIHCVVEEPEHEGHSHITFAIVEKSSDGIFSLKALKQKQMVDGLCYLLQEVYGIENKNAQQSRPQQDDDLEDNGSECVICMCETRDTIILPCRHLCLCNSCADNLRYQANNCPICRAKFHALLQIKAMRRRTNATEVSDDDNSNQNGIPPGYEAVALIEALNGPTQPHCACSVPTLPNDTTAQSLSSALENTPASEAGFPKEDCDAKTTKGDNSSELPLKSALDESSCDETQKQKNATAKDVEGKAAVPSSKEKDNSDCLDTTIPISDDEESEDPSTSAYATPLHQSRVVLRSSGLPQVDTGSPENGHPRPTDGGKLQMHPGGSDDSRYSSSSSTRDLLEPNPDYPGNEMEMQGIVGCTDNIDIKVV